MIWARVGRAASALTERFCCLHSYILKLLGVKVFSVSDVDQLGVARVVEETCDYISAK